MIAASMAIRVVSPFAFPGVKQRLFLLTLRRAEVAQLLCEQAGLRHDLHDNFNKSHEQYFAEFSKNRTCL